MPANRHAGNSFNDDKWMSIRKVNFKLKTLNERIDRKSYLLLCFKMNSYSWSIFTTFCRIENLFSLMKKNGKQSPRSILHSLWIHWAKKMNNNVWDEIKLNRCLPCTHNVNSAYVAHSTCAIYLHEKIHMLRVINKWFMCLSERFSSFSGLAIFFRTHFAWLFSVLGIVWIRYLSSFSQTNADEKNNINTKLTSGIGKVAGTRRLGIYRRLKLKLYLNVRYDNLWYSITWARRRLKFIRVLWHSYVRRASHTQTGGVIHNHRRRAK